MTLEVLCAKSSVVIQTEYILREQRY